MSFVRLYSRSQLLCGPKNPANSVFGCVLLIDGCSCGLRVRITPVGRQSASWRHHVRQIPWNSALFGVNWIAGGNSIVEIASTPAALEERNPKEAIPLFASLRLLPPNKALHSDLASRGR